MDAHPADLESCWAAARARGLPENGILLVVDAAGQRLTVLREGRAVATHSVSTSAGGLGQRENSHRTPAGLHRVQDRYGAGDPAGAVFRGRRFTGEVRPAERWSEAGGDDLILTRILRLSGLEPGVNQGPGVDSYERMIYIHGTNHEQDLGRPASQGCIRMANRDLVQLFDAVQERETWCWIR
jgi:hypothetical protein